MRAVLLDREGPPGKRGGGQSQRAVSAGHSECGFSPLNAMRSVPILKHRPYLWMVIDTSHLNLTVSCSCCGGHCAGASTTASMTAPPRHLPLYRSYPGDRLGRYNVLGLSGWAQEVHQVGSLEFTLPGTDRRAMCLCAFVLLCFWRLAGASRRHLSQWLQTVTCPSIHLLLPL